MGPVWITSVSFVYTGLLIWVFSQLQKLNLTYCLKLSLLLAFCFLLVCMVNQTQMYLSSISPLELFWWIICNIERLKSGEGGALNYWEDLNWWEDLIWKGRPQTYIMLDQKKIVSRKSFWKCIKRHFTDKSSSFHKITLAEKLRKIQS